MYPLGSIFTLHKKEQWPSWGRVHWLSLKKHLSRLPNMLHVWIWIFNRHIFRKPPIGPWPGSIICVSVRMHFGDMLGERVPLFRPRFPSWPRWPRWRDWIRWSDPIPRKLLNTPGPWVPSGGPKRTAGDPLEISLYPPEMDHTHPNFRRLVTLLFQASKRMKVGSSSSAWDGTSNHMPNHQYILGNVLWFISPCVGEARRCSSSSLQAQSASRVPRHWRVTLVLLEVE